MTPLLRQENGSYISPDDKGEPFQNFPRVSITDEEGLILQGFALGKDVLEIGTGLGVSTRYLAATAKRVVTVDIDPWVKEHIVLPSNVEMVIEPPLIDTELRFDMVFVDGSHIIENVIRDVHRAMHHVKPDGMIVMHDANYDNVQRGFEFIKREWEIIKTTHGLAVLRLGE